MSTNNPPFSTFTKLQVDIMASALAYAVRDTEDRIKEMLVNLRELSKDVRRPTRSSFLTLMLTIDSGPY